METQPSKRRLAAEKRIICAILHAISPYSLGAMAASSVVFITQRKKSQAVASQALQALLFQWITMLAPILVSAPLTGTPLIGATTAQASEFWSLLVMGMVISGIASAVFFQFIFPLMGLWAALQILQGHNFQYPLLGAVTRSETHKMPTSETQPEIGEETANPDNSNSERILAGMVHLSIAGVLAPILAPILWATEKQHSDFLTRHLLQAALFQILVIIMAASLGLIQMLLGVCVFFLDPLGRQQVGSFLGIDPVVLFFNMPWPLLLPWLIGTCVVLLLAGVAAISAFRGQPFRYPLVGRWLDDYLSR